MTKTDDRAKNAKARRARLKEIRDQLRRGAEVAELREAAKFTTAAERRAEVEQFRQELRRC